MSSPPQPPLREASVKASYMVLTTASAGLCRRLVAGWTQEMGCRSWEIRVSSAFWRRELRAEQRDDLRGWI